MNKIIIFLVSVFLGLNFTKAFAGEWSGTICFNDGEDKHGRSTQIYSKLLEDGKSYQLSVKSNQPLNTIKFINIGEGKKDDHIQPAEENIPKEIQVPTGWSGRVSRQFEGAYMSIFFRAEDTGNLIKTEELLFSLIFEDRKIKWKYINGQEVRVMDYSQAHFEVTYVNGGCQWGVVNDPPAKPKAEAVEKNSVPAQKIQQPEIKKSEADAEVPIVPSTKEAVRPEK